jgi:hypothetical protein
MTDAYPSPSAGPRDAFDEQPPLSQGERVIDTFIAPTKTFADIRRNRSWWLPMLVLAVFSYMFTLTALSHVGSQRLAESALRNNPSQNERLQQATPEQRAQTLRITATVMQVSFLGWPLLLPVLSALAALLLWVGFNFILGGSATYSGMFTVMMFAWLPSIFRGVLSTAMLFLGDPESFNINDPVGTNPGFYLGADSSAFLKAMLSSLDIFSIWILALMAIGGAIVARVKIRSGVILVFATWLIVALLRAAAAAAMS